MSIAFSDDFQQTYTRRLGVPRPEAAAAFESPDDLRVLIRAETTLALKQVGGRRYGHLLLVAERTSPPKLISAWPLPKGLIDPGTDVTSALRALCEAYGVPVVVPGQEPAPLAMDVVYRPIPQHISQIYQHTDDLTPRQAAKLITQIRVNMDPARNEMYLGLLYSIDVDKLARGIRG
jgi:hypothetical protein